jgi:UDP-N-acetyl-D-mannosaminuronic acid dehydrogenase
MLGGNHPVLIYDSWRILDGAAVEAAGIRYAALGYLPRGTEVPA